METALRVCVRVIEFLSMLWSAAITSAARASGCRKSSVVPGVDLGAPQADDAVGDDESEVSTDLGFPALNLLEGSGSQTRRQFCADVCDVAASAFASSATPRKVRTSGAAPKNVVPKLTSKLESSVLPRTTEVSFSGFLAVSFCLDLVRPCPVPASLLYVGSLRNW